MKDEIYRVVKESIIKGKFKELLLGEGEEKISLPRQIPGDVPADYDAIFTLGLIRLFNEDRSIYERVNIKSILLDMANGDTKHLYVSILFFWKYLQKNRSGQSPFSLETDEIISVFASAIEIKKDELKKDFRWMGASEFEGLWSEIKRIAKIWDKNYGIKLF